MFKFYRDAPTYYNGIELSATELNKNINNARILDAMSRRANNAHYIHRKTVGWEAKATPGAYVWLGGFRYKVGMTLARFVITGVKVSAAPRIKILFDDVEVYNNAVGTGTGNADVSIDDKGYSDDQVISVKVILFSNNPAEEITSNIIQVVDAFVLPLKASVSFAWPSTPTFGSINATNLNQLSNAEDYIAEWLGLVPYNANQSLLYFKSPSDRVGTWPFYQFVVTPSNGNENLRGAIYINSRHLETYIRINVNGTNFEYGPYEYGQNIGTFIDIDLIASAGCSPNADYVVTISERIVRGNPPGLPRAQSSRLSVGDMRVEHDSFTALTLPTLLNMTAPHTYSNMQGYLNTVSTAVSTIYSNMTTYSWIFDRARMFRSAFVVKDDQREQWETAHVGRNIRRGDVLWVKGKDLSINYGSISTTINLEDETWEYDFQYSNTLTSGDAVETKVFYLDQFEALYPGVTYFITGKELWFAAEYTR